MREEYIALILGVISGIVFLCMVVLMAKIAIRIEVKRFKDNYNGGYNEELRLKNHTILYTRTDSRKRKVKDVEEVFGKN